MVGAEYLAFGTHAVEQLLEVLGSVQVGDTDFGVVVRLELVVVLDVLVAYGDHQHDLVSVKQQQVVRSFGQ